MATPGPGRRAGASPEADHWLVRPENIRLMWQVFAGVLVFVTFAGLLAHIHGYFWIDGTFGFYSWYGFVTCAAMVFGARWLGFALKVPDDYYARQQDADESRQGER